MVQEGIRMAFDSASLMARAKATPVPGMDEQVVSELKDAVVTAKDTAGSVIQSLPAFVSDLLIPAVVLIAGLLLLRLGRFIIKKSVRRSRDPEAFRRAETTHSIVSSVFSYIMYFIIVLVVLRVYGVDLTSILAAAGVVGVAIAFGAQTLVKDILSGLFIWGERSLGVGDVVTINDLSGTVEAVSIRTTTIRNFNGNVCIIPNGDIRAITNMSRGFKRAIVIIPCPYEANQEHIVEMIREEMDIAAKEIEGIESVPEVMSIVAFESNSVTVQIAVACPVGEHWRIERDLRSRVKARFDREGIIMPHYAGPKQ